VHTVLDSLDSHVTSGRLVSDLARGRGARPPVTGSRHDSPLMNMAAVRPMHAGDALLHVHVDQVRHSHGLRRCYAICETATAKMTMRTTQMTMKRSNA